MNENKPVKHGALWTVLFAVVSLFWIFPIVLVLINSFKQKAYISKNAFSLPAGKAFVGLENYVRASRPRSSSPPSAGRCLSPSARWC